MQFSRHLSYERMADLPASEIRLLLAEIASISAQRVKNAVESLVGAQSDNLGAVDKGYLSDRMKRTAFFEEAERIAAELNELGHKLVPLDEDNDLNFESTSASWVHRLAGGVSLWSRS